MTIDQIITLSAAGLAFVASLFAAFVAAYNGRFQKFAQQKWWERKADVYTRIIEALADLVFYHETHLRAAEEGRDLPDDRRNEISEFWRRGEAEVMRAQAIGAFLISADADAALHRMKDERGRGVHPNDWYGTVESGYLAARDALKAVVAAAKADLNG